MNLMPAPVRYGSLTIHLRALDHCPELLPFAQQLSPATPMVWLDSARPHQVTGRWSLLGYDPWLTVVARGNRLEHHTSGATQIRVGHPLQTVRELLRRYRPRASPVVGRRPGTTLGAVSRAIGLLGYLSYEANQWIERLPMPAWRQRGFADRDPVAGPEPEMVWFAMKQLILLDHSLGRGWVVSVEDPDLPHRQARAEALEELDRNTTRLEAVPTHQGAGESFEPLAQAGAVQATTTQAEFESMAAQILKHIQAGDVYQANLAQRFSTTWQGTPLALYATLRAMNPSPFASFLSWGRLAIVSCSPERLVRVQQGVADSRPIAGTRPRGSTPTEEAVNSLELLLSEKERAEHLMLVDLTRNDLGRICTAGSVTVDELMALEAYSHVIHIVSNVSGRLRREIDSIDVIRAMFPGGTITGCPKVRCMQILGQLEPVPRGIYTGSLGSLGFDGALDLNIAIRTMVIHEDRLSFHVGAGIVADSDPQREYHETLSKAAALMRALERFGARTIASS